MSDMLLANFIKFLESKKLVRFDIVGDGDEQFENRFRIQKYAFLAKRFGLDLPYKHSMYLYGPYSRDLASDYYSMAKNRAVAYEPADGALDGRFDAGRFLSAVKDKDSRWLEIGTTLIEKKDHYDSREDLVEMVKHIKDDPRDEYVSATLSELESLRLVELSC